MTPTEALSSVIGREQAERIVYGLRQARLNTCSVAPEQLSAVDGRVRGRRFSSRVRLDAPVRAETSREVVGPVQFLLHLIERSGSTGRVWHKSLWLGRPDQPASRAGGMASVLGVCVRELERWIAALRTLKCVQNWQPPSEPGAGGARNARGRAYSVYQLPAFSSEFTRWQAGISVADQARAQVQAQAQVHAAPRRAPTELAARFMAMVPSPSSDSS